MFSLRFTDGRGPALSESGAARARSGVGGGGPVSFNRMPGGAVSGCGEGCDVRGFH